MITTSSQLKNVPQVKSGKRLDVHLEEASDAEQWTAVLGTLQGVTPFHQWAWLEWVAPLLSCRFAPLIVVDDAGVAQGIAPMLLRRRALWQTANWVPFPYLGPVVPEKFYENTFVALHRWARTERIFNLQISSHPCTTSLLDSGAFCAANGLSMHQDETYLLDLGGRGLDDVHQGLSRDTRHQLRLLERRGLTLREATTDEIAQLLPKIESETLRRQGLRSSYSDELGLKLAQNPPALPIRITSAIYNGVTVGVLVTLGGDISVGWIGGIMAEHRKSKANIALYWDAIRWAHENGSQALDMVGVPTPGVGAFKKQFGGTLRSYPVAQQTSLLYRSLVRLKK